jgi:hypothetical protein
MRTKEIRDIDPAGYDRAVEFWRRAFASRVDEVERPAMLVAAMLDVAVGEMVEQSGIRATGSALSATCLDLALLEGEVDQSIKRAGKIT